MTDPADDSSLLDEFRQFLEQHRHDIFEQREYPDLATLLSEMAGLKAEVKAESRQFKQALDTLSAALAAGEHDRQRLAGELKDWPEQARLRNRDALRALLLEIVDIYQRLAESAAALEDYRPATALFGRSRNRDIRFIKRFREGQRMTLRHFELLLERYQVRPIDCVGRIFDPEYMKATAVDSDERYAHQVVLAELRKGFWHQDRLLQPAEVKVNKLNAS